MEKGGISDRPNDMVDVYHTFFGIAGLSLMDYPELAPVDPVYALPCEVVNRLGLPQLWTPAAGTQAEKVCAQRS